MAGGRIFTFDRGREWSTLAAINSAALFAFFRISCGTQVSVKPMHISPFYVLSRTIPGFGPGVPVRKETADDVSGAVVRESTLQVLDVVIEGLLP